MSEGKGSKAGLVIFWVLMGAIVAEFVALAMGKETFAQKRWSV